MKSNDHISCDKGRMSVMIATNSKETLAKLAICANSQMQTSI